MSWPTDAQRAVLIHSIRAITLTAEREGSQRAVETLTLNGRVGSSTAGFCRTSRLAARGFSLPCPLSVEACP
eukprot:30577-Eustigmatos_ZCMA.PRE.1